MRIILVLYTVAARLMNRIQATIKTRNLSCRKEQNRCSFHSLQASSSRRGDGTAFRSADAVRGRPNPLHARTVCHGRLFIRKVRQRLSRIYGICIGREHTSINLASKARARGGRHDAGAPRDDRTICVYHTYRVYLEVGDRNQSLGKFSRNELTLQLINYYYQYLTLVRPGYSAARLLPGYYPVIHRFDYLLFYEFTLASDACAIQKVNTNVDKLD